MQEKNVWRLNGFLGILISLILILFSVALILMENYILFSINLIVALIVLSGITVVNPNQAVVVIFFGKYLGVIKESGLYLTVPLTLRVKVSLRVRNFNSAKLKVNDISGNPVEIAAVVVFKVVDAAKAIFDVDDYEKFVEIQSETALRHVATKYPYDSFDEGNLISLRANTDEVTSELTKELQTRLDIAGVQVLEARLTHLAYSMEIASAMLQRQQASAILAARKIIVEGAVSMAQLALTQLESEGIKFDEERKMQIINNLLVTIVSDRSAQPVINTGTIY